MNGVAYTGDRFDVTGDMEAVSLETAEKLLQPYPVGKEVALHYNPANPAEALLSTRVKLKSELMAIVFFTVLGFIFWGIAVADSIYLYLISFGVLALAALFHRWARPILALLHIDGKFFLFELHRNGTANKKD